MQVHIVQRAIQFTSNLNHNAQKCKSGEYRDGIKRGGDKIEIHVGLEAEFGGINTL